MASEYVPQGGRVGPEGGKVTLRDVANVAGVATSTVSRVLSNPGRISPKTAAAVMEAARQLGYGADKPPVAASVARPRAVALLVPDIANPFYFDIIHGTQEQLKAAGYIQLLVNTEESADLEQAALNSMMSSSQGVILAASRLSTDSLAMAASQVPLVALNRNDADVPAVLIDPSFGVQQAFQHLVSLDHRRIAYVSGPAHSWSSQWRWQVFEEAAREHQVEAVRLGPYSPKQTSGAAAADALITSRATACLAFNDLLAIGMLRRLLTRGVKVPEDVSIVGFDDIFGADFCNPPLTTITAPIEQAARVATSMLLKRLGGDPAAERQVSQLPTYLTVRESTGVAPSARAGGIG
ncbi:LacI family transcriptional regulator [Arthrobacter stackebrandtii]|uniref:LacI family transcriptional regulator n=1 Tax=Arthrobacter stackebrandtii TaxID=272161 RepID=A0ABS4YYK7_9MICC|nr:LacI family DNA-binding transcriptional regulator [Arthrobacter stackebrandtii]MBP2413824.1 LacI family transcriptional regulator [Arthrobacter stackebrandtii]PYH00402.1 LacI family transcriptional regulator [Arthrobacter stackebrandtii]